MDLINVEEKIRLLKNLLEDPDDEISREILRLDVEEKKNCEVSGSNSSVITTFSKPNSYKS